MNPRKKQRIETDVTSEGAGMERKGRETKREKKRQDLEEIEESSGDEGVDEIVEEEEDQQGTLSAFRYLH